MEIMLNIFSKKKPIKETCILCQKELTQNYSSLSYEYINDDGQVETAEYGKVCSSCSSILDKGEIEIEAEED
jgi:hypothetical protein